MSLKYDRENVQRADDLLAQGRQAIDRGDLRAAEKSARKALKLLDAESDDPEVRQAVVRGHLQLAYICTATHRIEEGLRLIDRLRELDPDERETDYHEGCLRLSQWGLAAAAECFRACLGNPQLRAMATYYLAVLSDLRDAIDEADELYAEAHALDPKRFSVPIRMSDEEAEALLREVLSSLPEQILKRLRDPLIEMRSVPDAKLDRVHPETLGVYQGVTVAEQSSRFLPEYIRVFKRSIERIARNEADLREQLRITLLHEIGHHFGYDEDGLDELGLR